MNALLSIQAAVAARSFTNADGLPKPLGDGRSMFSVPRLDPAMEILPREGQDLAGKRTQRNVAAAFSSMNEDAAASCALGSRGPFRLACPDSKQEHQSESDQHQRRREHGQHRNVKEKRRGTYETQQRDQDDQIAAHRWTPLHAECQQRYSGSIRARAST